MENAKELLLHTKVKMFLSYAWWGHSTIRAGVMGAQWKTGNGRIQKTMNLTKAEPTFLSVIYYWPVLRKDTPVHTLCIAKNFHCFVRAFEK